MRRIIVTPAGRRRYMELQAAHLAKQRSSFDEWHIWLNTCNQTDAAYCRSLDAVVVEPAGSVPAEGCLNIHRFFPVDGCRPDTLYLRLDDDVVWMEPTFINDVFQAREQERTAFLLFANIINNAICSHIHWRLGMVDRCGYACMDAVGWRSPAYAEHVHRRFLASENLEAWKFPRWWLDERFSINAMAWRGEEFAKFDGRVGVDEEHWLTSRGPNVVYGRALCAHFAFHTQRDHLDTTDILSLYRGKL